MRKRGRSIHTFENFLPELLTVFEGITPQNVDHMISKTKADGTLN